MQEKKGDRALKAGQNASAITGGRRHRGDFMSPETRSAVMSRIRGKDTGPERAVAEALRARGWEFETHARDLPGRPDILFRHALVAVFIDGDFWHGWRFPAWKDKLSEKWEAKIETTRRRDARNFRKLRRDGWKVIRIWEHQVNGDLTKCVERVEETLPRRRRESLTRSRKSSSRQG